MAGADVTVFFVFEIKKGRIFPLTVAIGYSRTICTMFDCFHISVPDCDQDSGLSSARLSKFRNFSRTSVL
jgi:hypothetical protein